MIDKINNSTSQDESRIIFDYSRVKEDLLDIYMKLSFKIYNNLSNFRYKCPFATNLKHVYLIISLYSKNRYYYSFIISDINQLQLNRIQQDSKSIEFMMIELDYRAFEALSTLYNKLFFLYSTSHEDLSVLTFYIDNLFDNFRSFQKQYDFLRKHFFSRVEQIFLRLSFRKFKLFAQKIKVLEVIYSVENIVRILKERI